MSAELGLFFLIIALLTSSLQASYLLPSHRVRRLVSPCLVPAAWLQALMIVLAFALLITLRLDSDFSVANVVMHSNRTLPLLYKVAGAWGNHEGSMLLWVLVLAVFGAGFAFSQHTVREEEQQFRAYVIAAQSFVCAGFLLFLLFTSNPFARIFPPPPDGEALNPLLQDMALSIHPPLLYFGYVGFSIVYSLAVAALLQGRAGKDWAEAAHPWILISWTSLTVGIGLGSWWAYRVLGWGGFWFWDPVENASLLPWLSGTALLHSNIVLKKRGALAQWVILLAIITFGLSLLGTFLVRSGVLVSVHSFASDPARGFFILMYSVALIGSALLLYAFRAHKLGSDDHMMPVSREGIIVLNNLFLLTACATVLLGTIYPMMAEWIEGERLTVGPSYFNLTFLPIIAIPLLLAGLSPFIVWRQVKLGKSLRPALPALMAALAAFVFVLAATKREPLLAAMGLGLAAWLLAASLRWLKAGSVNAPVFLGHAGAALVIVGITCAGLWKQEAQQSMTVGESVEIAGYRVTYYNARYEKMPNYLVRRDRFRVSDLDGNEKRTLSPEYRHYDIRDTAISKPSIRPLPLSDLYAVTGESSPDGKKTAVRIYYQPMVNLLWAGCLMMAAGGMAALIQRLRRRRLPV